MLEVVFDQGAAGGMAVAMAGGRRAGCTVGVVFACSEDGEAPSRAEPEQLRREREERRRRGRAEAVPMEGSREDILCFSLALSVGEIDEEGIGPRREAALARLWSTCSAHGRALAAEQLNAARQDLKRLLSRAKEGAPVRVWGSRNPDDCCGLCWLMAQLCPPGPEGLDITLVRLPQWEERPDGTVVRYSGWGEVEPCRLGSLAALGERLPPNAVRAMAGRWRALREENAPLRAVLNGQLVSVPEALYDPFLLRELAGQGEEFQEAAVIGAVLGKYQLGIGDGWLALRMEQFVREGRLKPVSQPGPDEPAYRRRLRKIL